MASHSSIHKYRSGSWAITARLFLLSLLLSPPLLAETVHIAVASNFVATLRLLTTAFGIDSPHEFKISSASTGKLFAQIKHGAPFDVFLAADAKRPGLLAADGYADPKSLFTYALGRLALWRPVGVGDNLTGPEILNRTTGRLAIANPKTAPYGKAAEETLRALGLWKDWQPKLVRGENIAQTYQFVASGGAESGFIALSQFPGHGVSKEESKKPRGQLWIVPLSLHAPLRQQAVLTAQGTNNRGAGKFMGFLKSPKARKIIRTQGYDLPDS
uniref:Molybdate transport system substrate-binding protein n=1 Tax=Candidatus Kentrum sp. FW TaxID=2126338 RepID=A0A450SVY8_9GAMM|nr:MAG: molybdate transport system substrate-binding protein [Candidatus Kentron sp. FW]VFJ58183.1 MAG: molybdate transport system substrate-binding protein [Candidatus Kentron sp. FW]